MSNAENLRHWVADQLHTTVEELQWHPLAGDASFRKYFRCYLNGESYMAALAPPEKENNEAFVQIANLLVSAGVKAPMVIAHDYQHGFLLQSDFGNILLRDSLNNDSVDFWYRKAMQQLLQMMTITQDQLSKLPDYNDQALRNELSFFQTWFVEGLLAHQCSQAEVRMLESFFDALVDNALEQPQVFVHRDYHCRNIMITDDNQLATIDFQDGVRGPVSYDIVSLLRDCYVVWPEEKVRQWVYQYWQLLGKQGIVRVQESVFQEWFDLMGLQRHIKVLGVFSRLFLRDDKPAYLGDLPTVINYVLQVARQHSVATEFLEWFETALLPLARQQSWGAKL